MADNKALVIFGIVLLVMAVTMGIIGGKLKQSDKSAVDSKIAKIENSIMTKVSKSINDCLAKVDNWLSFERQTREDKDTDLQNQINFLSQQVANLEKKSQQSVYTEYIIVSNGDADYVYSAKTDTLVATVNN